MGNSGQQVIFAFQFSIFNFYYFFHFTALFTLRYICMCYVEREGRLIFSTNIEWRSARMGGLGGAITMESINSTDQKGGVKDF